MTVSAVVGCGSTDLDVIERLPRTTAEVQASPPPVTAATPTPTAMPIAPPSTSAVVPDLDPPAPAEEPRDAGTPTEPEPATEPVIDTDGGCPSAIVPLNLYRFRSAADDQCLAAGNAGFDGYDVVMTDCTSAAASWQLIASTLEAYEIRNVMVDYNVDIEFANVAAGSNVVLFAAPGGPSQKFTFAELEDGTLTVNPRSASDLCLHGDAVGVWLERCRDASTTQKWYIDPDECTPTE